MQISIIAVGKVREAYYRAAVDDYNERIRRIMPLVEIEVPSGSGETGNGHGQGTLHKEADSLLKQIQKPGILVALNVKGKQMSSEKFAEWLQNQMTNSVERIYFVIGGAWGLSAKIIEKATLELSLSEMTLPHELARVVLVEQIYRGLTVWKNHPYHK